MSSKNPINDLKLNIPKYTLHVPEISRINTPELDIMKVKPKPLKYEDSIFKKLADDVKSPMEQQLESLQIIAESAQKQAEAAQTQARLAEEAAEKAKADATIARRDARFAKIVSVLAILVPVLQNILMPYLPIIVQYISGLQK